MQDDDVNQQGGPAFPVSIPGCGDNGWQGMTLRDYFAGQSLPAVLSTLAENPCPEWAVIELFGRDATGVRNEDIAAALSYGIADAMLRRRQK